MPAGSDEMGRVVVVLAAGASFPRVCLPLTVHDQVVRFGGPDLGPHAGQVDGTAVTGRPGRFPRLVRAGRRPR
jgi:hypothetical protein